MQILRAKLYEIKLSEQQEAVTSMRRSQVGTGSRSEKIRTGDRKLVQDRDRKKFARIIIKIIGLLIIG